MRLGDYWLSQRPNSAVWCISWFDPATRQVVRRSTGTKDQADAEKLLAEHYLKNRKLDAESPSDVAIELLLDRYLETKSLRATDTAKRAIALWKEYWSGKTLNQLSPADQTRFHAWLSSRTHRGRKLSPATVVRYVTQGNAAIAAATRSGLVSGAVPALLSPVVGGSAPAVRNALRIDAARKVWRCSGDQPHWHRYIWLAFATGARPGAILDLTWDRVDLKNKRIDFLPAGAVQTKKRRPIVPIIPSLLTQMKKWDRDAELVVHWRGEAISRARETFRRLAERSGVDVTAYVIRHTVATELRIRDVPEWEIETLLGHRLPGSATTARYTHLRPDYLKTCVRELNKYVRSISK